ncbi:hypothetical protein PTTG_08698 [Puccinia triticina 1-1 BBBD Race 1]|uniref:3-hydroxybutyryl-CoA dehydrogenase n=2 Tax=Puccinia triticina TaxID=208348 RepID=A0A180G313_PUCT1|nr:uncharacterized protein PtA15_5A693 [Puccinia triticina]OAV86990.1 hypothetical protein PTTG_08698 [Puccinia triticina 1-1 BBBD Race 1]WAQ85119.1 hypothetical protein PtA15_5A693 [Puccinia triticina]WAR58458.1 hypothetical protein PtB15_5B692 [Puccinia triticina]
MRLAQSSSLVRQSGCLHSGHSMTRVTPWRDVRLGTLRKISTVGVIGAGQMGTGIAFVAAKNAGVNVLLHDQLPEAQKKGLAFIDKLLAKDVAKEKLTENEATGVRGRVRAIGELNELRDVDLVIEAVAEKLSLKQTIFSQLASICKPSTILASNTSSISLTKIAASAINPNQNPHQLASPDPSPSRVVGLHFFNPVPVMSLVELIAALQTSEDTLKRAREFAARCGKVVTVSKDTPGFISNRVLMPMINEAIICLEEGVATREDIDQTMKRGTNVPMGPLTLADFIGLDTCLSIMQVLYSQTSDSKYRPSVLLSRMVDAGWLGKKVGKGFYEYGS